MKDINRGLIDAMRLRDSINRTLKGGNLSDVKDLVQLAKELERVYGKIPMTSEANAQIMHDTTVAESIQLHNDAFRYAEDIDPEAERMKEYAQIASPQGAAKASLQAQGVQIHVLNQILRTNAALLKVQSENLAMQNRKSKFQSEQFRQQYTELSTSLAVLYFARFIMVAIYHFAWVFLTMMAPLLLLLHVFTSQVTINLFKSMFEIATWKVAWSLLSVMLKALALKKLGFCHLHRKG